MKYHKFYRFIPGHSDLRLPFEMTLVILLTFLWGCNGPGSSFPAAYEQANQAYNAGRYATVQQTLIPYLTSGNISKTQKCKAHYLRGLCYRQQGHAFFAAAQKDFETVLAYSCDKQVTGQAHTAIGHILFESSLSDIAKAQHHYRQALELLEDDSIVEVLFRLGVCLQRQGQWRKARPYFQQCMNDFPSSPLAQNAKERLGCRVFRLQAGAYSNLSRANLQIGELNRAGWSCDAKLKIKGSQTLYLVQSGAYTGYQQAYNQLNKLKRITPSAIIVATKK